MKPLAALFAVASLVAAGSLAVVQIDTIADLFAVGDAHSDYVHLVRALEAAEIIAGSPEHPEQVRWRGAFRRVWPVALWSFSLAITRLSSSLIPLLQKVLSSPAS